MQQPVRLVYLPAAQTDGSQVGAAVGAAVGAGVGVVVGGHQLTTDLMR